MRRRVVFLISCCVGLVAMFMTRWFMSRYLFGMYDAVHPLLRDGAVGASVLVLAGVAVVAAWRPRWITGRGFAAALVALLGVGLCLVACGLASGLHPMVAVGAVVTDIGHGLFCLAVCLGCLGLAPAPLASCIAGAYIASYLLRLPLDGLGQIAGVVGFGVSSLVGVVFALPAALRGLACLKTIEAPAELAVTHPASYLPLGHRLFVSLLLFEVVYGYATHVAGGGSDPAGWSWVVLAGFACVGALSFVCGAPGKPDLLFKANVLMVVAGLLTMLLEGRLASIVGEGVLSLGSGCFQILAFFFLLVAGQRNRANSVVVIAWGLAIMSAGVMLGAWLSRLPVILGLDAVGASYLTAVVIFALLAAVFVYLEGFSIAATLEGVEDAARGLVSPVPDVAIEQRCRRLADAFGLTARETEVLVLLARGRNSPYIQAELGVSYNTARTHVRHIYEKCGFHTQQELIDAVEKA